MEDKGKCCNSWFSNMFISNVDYTVLNSLGMIIFALKLSKYYMHKIYTIFYIFMKFCSRGTKKTHTHDH